MRIKEKNTKVRLIVAIILAIVMTVTIIVSKNISRRALTRLLRRRYLRGGGTYAEAVLTRRRCRVVLTGQGRH